MQDLADLRLVFADFEAQQVAHLPVAILFDHVDAVVIRDELLDVVGERQRAQAKVIRFEVALAAQLIARLLEREVGGAVRDESDLRAATVNHRLRHILLRRLILPRQPIDGSLVILGTFRVAAVCIVTGAAREVRRHIRVAGKRTERNTVAVDVEVASPLSA